MRFYTKEYLKNRATRNLNESRTFSYVANKNKQLKQFDIFLSHSFKDKEYIEGLFIELESKGYTVYVDWIIDSHLQRNNVTKRTVNHIQRRMKQSKSLVYATSKNASSSKWMPWELGYMDGYKGKCAILPITDYETSDFKGHEFLSVYPIIGKDNNYPNNLKIELGLSESQSMKSWINI